MTQSFELQRIGALGALVTGIDLTKEVDEQVLTDLKHSLTSHGVLFFQDQFIDAEQQLSLARKFGELTLYPIERFFGSVEPGHQIIVDDAAAFRRRGVDRHGSANRGSEAVSLARLAADCGDKRISG